MRREKKRSAVLIAVLLCVFCFMSVGYAAFSTQLNIRGTMNITGKWDVHITGVTVAATNGLGENAIEPTYTANTASVSANLYEKGDFVTYKVTITNAGNINAKLGDVVSTNNGLGAVKITYTVPEKDSVLAPNETADIIVKVEYDSTYNGEILSNEGTATISINYIQA